MTAEIDTHLRHGSCGRPWLNELGTRIEDRDRLDPVRRSRPVRAAVPERLAVDEWGFPIVLAAQVPADLRHHARRAVAACPVSPCGSPPSRSARIGGAVLARVEQQRLPVAVVVARSATRPITT